MSSRSDLIVAMIAVISSASRHRRGRLARHVLSAWRRSIAADLAGHARGDVLHFENFSDGTGDPGRVTGLHPIARLYRVGAKARHAGGRLADPPIWMIVLMHFVTLLLGGPIGGIPLIMMTIPIFIPVVKVLGYEPVWFCTAMLLNVEWPRSRPRSASCFMSCAVSCRKQRCSK